MYEDQEDANEKIFNPTFPVGAVLTHLSSFQMTYYCASGQLSIRNRCRSNPNDTIICCKWRGGNMPDGHLLWWRLFERLPISLFSSDNYDLDTDKIDNSGYLNIREQLFIIRRHICILLRLSLVNLMTLEMVCLLPSHRDCLLLCRLAVSQILQQTGTLSLSPSLSNNWF